jgi:hypothetical protein
VHHTLAINPLLRSHAQSLPPPTLAVQFHLPQWCKLSTIRTPRPSSGHHHNHLPFNPLPLFSPSTAPTRVPSLESPSPPSSHIFNLFACLPLGTLLSIQSSFNNNNNNIMKKNTNSMIVWQSPTIQLIISGLNHSTNRKTGNMVQSYILRRDVSPIEALATNKDRSICGDCPLRGTTINGKRTARPCYVNVGQGPQSVWKGQSNFAGKEESISGRTFRMGTYGDPAFVPVSVWRRLLSNVIGWTGYTHQWRKATSQGLKTLVMASCESIESKNEANALGWRTFRVMRQNQWAKETLQPDEVLCPASEEAGRKTTCENCRLCSGTSKKAKNVAIYAHSAQKVNLK